MIVVILILILGYILFVNYHRNDVEHLPEKSRYDILFERIFHSLKRDKYGWTWYSTNPRYDMKGTNMRSNYNKAEKICHRLQYLESLSVEDQERLLDRLEELGDYIVEQGEKNIRSGIEDLLN